MSNIVDRSYLHFINAHLFERRTCGDIYISENVQAKLRLTMDTACIYICIYIRPSQVSGGFPTDWQITGCFLLFDFKTFFLLQFACFCIWNFKQLLHRLENWQIIVFYQWISKHFNFVVACFSVCGDSIYPVLCFLWAANWCWIHHCASLGPGRVHCHWQSIWYVGMQACTVQAYIHTHRQTERHTHTCLHRHSLTQAFAHILLHAITCAHACMHMHTQISAKIFTASTLTLVWLCEWINSVSNYVCSSLMQKDSRYTESLVSACICCFVFSCVK